MKRVALWLSLVFLPSCCVAAGAAKDAASTPTLVLQLERESVALVKYVNAEGEEIALDSKEPGGLGTYCTGTWVNADTILTAEHCVDEIGKPALPKTTISNNLDDIPDPKKLLEDLIHSLKAVADQQVNWTPVGQPVMYSTRNDIDPRHKAYHTGTVIAADLVNDMALIRAPGAPAHPIVRLRKGLIRDGEELHLVGNEAGMWWSYRRGYVASWRPEQPDNKGHLRSMLQVSAPIFFGDSGSGGFDSDGNMVGMCDSISKVPNVAFYLHRDTIQAFLVREHVISANK
jgi:hypothetical protein